MRVFRRQDRHVFRLSGSLHGVAAAAHGTGYRAVVHVRTRSGTDTIAYVNDATHAQKLSGTKRSVCFPMTLVCHQ